MAIAVVVAVLALLATHEPGARSGDLLLPVAVASATPSFATGAAASPAFSAGWYAGRATRG